MRGTLVFKCASCGNKLVGSKCYLQPSALVSSSRVSEDTLSTPRCLLTALSFTQGTISKFFGPAASRAAGGPSSSPSAANTRKRGAAGSGSHVASKPGQAGAPAAATASADGRGGLPQGEVKGSWSQALSIKHNNNTGRWVRFCDLCGGALASKGAWCHFENGCQQRGVWVFCPCVCFHVPRAFGG
eukprot:1157390-Pelagomonas_calceolata.AAC.8